MKSVKKNYIYNLIYQIFTIITPFITTPYVSRVLGASGVGEYSFGLSLVTYFAILGTLGITTYAQISIAKERDDEEKSSKIVADLFIIKTITMILSLITYSLFICFYPTHKSILIVLSLYLLSQINDVSWILQGLEKFQELVIRNIFVKFISICLIFLCVKDSSDLYLYTIIMQGTIFLGNFFLWPYTWQYIKPSELRQNFNHKNVKYHLKNSLVYFVPTIATTVYTVLDKSMIGWITNSDIQNGFYEQAHKIEQILLVFITSLGTVTLPRMTYLNAKRDNNAMNDLMRKSIMLVLLISFPMAFGLIGIAENLIPIFLGNEYYDCIILVKIFSFLLIIVGLDNTIGRQCLMATNNQKKFNIGVICGAVVNVVINLLLIPKYGALGAAIASVCAELIILIIFTYFGREYLKLDIFKSVIKYVVATIIMMIVVYLCNNIVSAKIIVMLIQITIGAIAYFLILLLLREEMTMDMLKILKSKFIK